MRITEKTKTLVKSFEGLELKAYRCPAGVLTIGYGHTGDVREGQVITESEADSLLEKDLLVCEETINRLVSVPLTDSQFDALADFIFNLGEGNFKESTLLKKINSGAKPYEVVEQFKRWVYSGGSVLPGLVRRRDKESELWLG